MKDIKMISLSIRGTNSKLPTVAKHYKFRRIERNSAEIKLAFLHMICTPGTIPSLTWTWFSPMVSVWLRTESHDSRIHLTKEIDKINKGNGKILQSSSKDQIFKSNSIKKNNWMKRVCTCLETKNSHRHRIDLPHLIFPTEGLGKFN